MQDLFQSSVYLKDSYSTINACSRLCQY